MKDGFRRSRLVFRARLEEAPVAAPLGIAIDTLSVGLDPGPLLTIGAGLVLA